MKGWIKRHKLITIGMSGLVAAAIAILDAYVIGKVGENSLSIGSIIVCYGLLIFMVLLWAWWLYDKVHLHLGQ